MENQNEFEIEKQLVIISIPTISKLLSFKKRGSDALLLYLFYYYTAKWQGTNQPKATPSYCMKGLQWGDIRFNEADKLLRKLNLIEKNPQKDELGRFTGWYVKINYIWTTKKERELNLKSSKSRGSENLPSGIQGTNALSVNSINASNGKQYKKNVRVATRTPYPNDFLTFYEQYPVKIGKKAAFRAWKKAKDKPSLKKIIEAVQKQKNWQNWKKGFIPHPATWLNQGRWDDEEPQNQRSEEDIITPEVAKKWL